MKKLLFFSILMMAVLSVNYSLKEPRVNTLLLDNIEALAADEQDVPDLERQYQSVCAFS